MRADAKTNTFAIALDCIGRGWSPVPVPHGADVPDLPDWQNLRITAETANRYFGTDALQNVGVLTGEASGGLVVVRLYGREARSAADPWLPATFSTFGQGDEVSHHLYQTGDSFTPAIWRRPDRSAPGKELPFIEVFGGGTKGACVLFPGSTNARGEELRWLERHEPAEVDGTTLLECCEEVFAIALLARNWPEQGADTEHRRALYALLFANEWSVNLATVLVDAVVEAAGGAVDLIRSRAEEQVIADGMNAGESILTLFSAFAGLVGKEVASQAAHALKLDTQPKPVVPGTYVRASRLAGQTVPVRAWHVPDLVPSHTVTLLGGDGGTGKSLLAMQLAVATALGRPWLGRPVGKGQAIYLSAEDDQEELHRRLAAIAVVEGFSLAHLRGLTIRSLVGQDAVLGRLDQETRELRPTPLFWDLDKRVKEEMPSLVVLDTLADLHDGDENVRSHARQFIGILSGLASRHGCAVVVLAHPSLAGIATRTGLSGSTAWNASVRSRLFLERVVDKGHNEGDCNLRRLSVKKANYSLKGEEMTLRWHNGVFVADEPSSRADRAAASDKARRVFLELLRLFAEDGREVNEGPGRSSATVRFAEDPRAEGVTKNGFKAAMSSLFADKLIRIEEMGPASKRRKRIVEV